MEDSFEAMAHHEPRVEIVVVDFYWTYTRRNAAEVF